MGEEDALVIVAGYQDLDTARRDFQTLTERTEHERIPLRGAVLVGKGDDGEPVLVDTGSRLGRLATEQALHEDASTQAVGRGAAG
jgi:hypothetical protein